MITIAGRVRKFCGNSYQGTRFFMSNCKPIFAPEKLAAQLLFVFELKVFACEFEIRLVHNFFMV